MVKTHVTDGVTLWRDAKLWDITLSQYASVAETEREWAPSTANQPSSWGLRYSPGLRDGKTWGTTRISDAHEWINEIPTVPIYYLAKPQPRERAWKNQRGKKTLLSLTLVRLCEMSWEV